MHYLRSSVVIGKEINNRSSFPIYQGKNFRKFISVDIARELTIKTRFFLRYKRGKYGKYY